MFQFRWVDYIRTFFVFVSACSDSISVERQSCISECCRSEQGSLSVHQRGASAQWRALHSRQHSLPLPQHTEGTWNCLIFICLCHCSLEDLLGWVWVWLILNILKAFFGLISILQNREPCVCAECAHTCICSHVMLVCPDITISHECNDYSDLNLACGVMLKETPAV